MITLDTLWKTRISRCLFTAVLLLAFWLATVAPVVAGVSVAETDNGRLRVANEYFTIELLPERGAQALSFKTRYSPREWITGNWGLFQDRFVGQNWPGELAESRHVSRILARGPEKVVLEFQVTSQDKILVTRRMTFSANSPVIQVNLSMTNQGTQSAVRGLWPQFVMSISGIKENNRYFRPSNQGINMAGWDEKTKLMTGDSYVKETFAGWTGALNTGTGEGVVWLTDYNWLKWFYNCPPAWTVEWVYDYAAIPKQEKWETDYAMILVNGYPGFCHASANLIAGMKLRPTTPGEQVSDLVITHTLGRSMNGDIRDAKLKGALRGWNSNEEYPLPEIDAGVLAWEPKTLTHTVKVKPNRRLVCDMVLTGTDAAGKQVREAYSFYWPGSGENIDLPAGTTATPYSRKPPRKTKIYTKPKDLVFHRNADPRMLEFRGVYYYLSHVSEAATKAGVSEIRGSHFDCSSFGGNALSYLPSSFEEMFEFDLAVINDVDASCLTDFGQEVLAQFVNAGGNLLVLGGPHAFGKSGLQDTRLEEILPVEVVGVSADSSPSLLHVAPSALILQGVQFKTKGYCYWLHQVKPKAGAWVEMTTGKNPFLICGRYGNGKVAVVAGSTLGTAPKNAKGFWETDDWVNALSRIIHWMVLEN
ncbi:MAG: hypothetical protein ACYC7E_06165 [Armatimonadota bacterium]